MEQADLQAFPISRPAGSLGTRYGAGTLPMALAHRGGAGLAPENTLAAFGLAYGLGLRYLESDLQLTADGVCVAFHDADTARATGVPGRISKLSWAEVCRLRVNGERIPRVEELFEAFPDARFSLDLKDPASIAPLARLLRRPDVVHRVCLAGSSDRQLAALRTEVGPDLAISMGWESLTRLALAARFGRRPPRLPQARFAHVPLRLAFLPVFSARLVELAHELGTKVLVWTVDDPRTMHELLDHGVDGIFTDRPDLLREVLLARNQWQVAPVG